MQVDIVIEQRFYQCEEGKFWTKNAFPYPFWQRYLGVFSKVNIVARVKRVTKPHSNWHRVDGNDVGFLSLPIYLGPLEFVFRLPKLIAILNGRRNEKRAVILRIPGILSYLYVFFAMEKRPIYAVEVVGDPMDTFAKGANQNSFRLVFQRFFTGILKKQCKNACATSYVTEFSLQKRYPPSENAFTTHYSSIQLSNEDYKARTIVTTFSSIKIICIGNLSQPYKGCDYMLRVLAKLINEGFSANLRWIGGGELLENMKFLARQLGIEKYVSFAGNIAERDHIRGELDLADLFILSSRQEGLPRVLIEAMARGLPCLATNVGGVAELLDEAYLVERDNEEQLLEKIKRMYQLNQHQLAVQSQKNFDRSTDYSEDCLSARREAMYKALLKQSI